MRSLLILRHPSSYMRNIVPIGALFSASLVFSNLAYITLSVSFIQMLVALSAPLAPHWT